MSTKRKISTKLGQPMVKPSAKVLGKGQLNESRTVASEGGVPVKADINGFKKGEVVDISSDSESAEEDSDDGEDSASGAEEDVAMGDAEEAPVPDDTEEPAEPSFGDLVRANASEPIDVAAAFEDPSSGALSAYPHGSQIQAPVGTSLGTVLSQALKTNDVSLLESCLHTTDLNTVRATIQRLDSRLAAVLLHKLAERLHRRPGRSGSLMVWVQWTLVTHGGFLASQPDLVKRIAELNRVIDDRSKALQNLLAVKGKLDMLDAQMELRRSMQRQQGGFEDEEEDEGVIYVEGEESEEDATTNGKHLTSNGGLDDFSDGSEDSEDMPLTNGMVADSEEEDEDSEEDDLIDDEAVETDAESGDEDEVDHDDQDGEISESEEEVSAAPPKKVSRISGLFSRGKK